MTLSPSTNPLRWTRQSWAEQRPAAGAASTNLANTTLQASTWLIVQAPSRPVSQAGHDGTKAHYDAGG